MSEKFRVIGNEGRVYLSGDVFIHGAKNASLQAFALSALFSDKITIENVPHIEDIKRMSEILTDIGAEITTSGHNIYSIQFKKKPSSTLPDDLMKNLRASVILLGPILARTGEVVFSHPGGCVIGARPIDIFIDAFQKMGAKFEESKGRYRLHAKNGLHGSTIFLRLQSVTATQAIMFAAILAKGETVIKNAALEPETKHLADFLNSCGAKIQGAGTTTIRIMGVSELSSKNRTYQTLPDRIETSSYAILATLLGWDITIKKCNPVHSEILLEILRSISKAKIIVDKSSIRIINSKKQRILPINLKTHEYPGFPTDIQAPMAVLLTQAKGESQIFETIFENRLNYIEALNSMGANITQMDTHRILVKGPTKLKGKEILSPDIRAGLAYIIAALIAKGESVIHNVYYIDRGYENVEINLSKLGANIKRVN